MAEEGSETDGDITDDKHDTIISRDMSLPPPAASVENSLIQQL